MKITSELLILAIESVENAAMEESNALHSIDDLKEYLEENEDGVVVITSKRR